MIFRARQFEFSFPRPALVMGILNVTPDSFSDGGRFYGVEAAVAQGLAMVAQGAEIIDVGGESTRPQATPVEEAEELRRVLPVIERLAAQVKVPISIDTMKPRVARAALAAGASIVNDVAANRTDPAMWQVVAETGAGYVAMHMQGTPQTMQLQPTYGNLLSEIHDFLVNRLDLLEKTGVARECVILDVGIGFGKTVEHNLQLLAGMKHFTKLGRPLLLGISRKSFLGKVPGLEAADRLSAALACTASAVAAGVNIIRTHDVAPTLNAIRMVEAISQYQ